MRTITVRDGQSIYDIAMQYYGDTSAALKVVQDNNLTNLNAQLFGGQTLQIDTTFSVDSVLATFFSQQRITHATSDPKVIDGEQFDDSFDESFA